MQITSNFNKIYNVKTSKANNIYQNKNIQSNDTVSFGAFPIESNYNDISLSKLSDRVAIHPRNAKFNIISLPKSLEMRTIDDKGNEVTLPLNKDISSNSVPRIAIIDVFSSGNNGKDVRSLPKMSHGDIVSKVATSKLDDKVEVIGLDVSNKHHNSSIDAIVEATDYLVKMKENGVRIDAVNLSIACEVTSLGLALDLEETHSKTKEELTEAILTTSSRAYKPAYKIIKNINKLIESGTEVFIGAGNYGISLFALSNAEVVAGTNSRGEIIFPSTGTTKYITNKQPGELKFKPMFDGLKIKGAKANGIEFQQDGNIPILPFTIRGSSFSTPMKLNEYMNEKLKIKN